MKILHETTILKHLNHKNIVKFYETFESNHHILIIMEYVSCGDLLSFVRKRSKLSESVARYIFRQIIDALNYMHSKGVIHRDIKLDNILIDLNNTIKICDFGVSKQIKKGEVIYDQCGTPAYIAPEILKNEGFQGSAADIWSAGIVLYAMVQGRVPFFTKDVQELYLMITKNPYTPLQKCSHELEDLIRLLLEKDPRKRITGDQILNHPWMRKSEYQQKAKVNFFTAAERVMFTKNNIDYRNANNKEDNLEEFTLKNLDTVNLKAEEHIKTKSLILAPFNTSAGNSMFMDKTLELNNNYVKYKGKVRELNKNYELNNNCEIDNGMIISPNGNTFNSLNNESLEEIRGKSELKKKISSNKFNKGIHSIRASGLSSPLPELEKGSLKTESNLDEAAVNSVISLGYSSNFVVRSLLTNNLNYATACYYLMLKGE